MDYNYIWVWGLPGLHSKFKASLSYTVRAYSSYVTCFSGTCKYLGCNFQYKGRKGKEAPTMSAYPLYPALGKYRQVDLWVQGWGRLENLEMWGGGEKKRKRKKSTNSGQKKRHTPQTQQIFKLDFLFILFVWFTTITKQSLFEQFVFFYNVLCLKRMSPLQIKVGKNIGYPIKKMKAGWKLNKISRSIN